MGKILNCDINLFALKQQIKIYEGNKNIKDELIDTDKLKEELPRIIDQYGIEIVNLYGMKSFAEGIKTAIETSLYQYQLNKKKVEVRIKKKWNF